MERWLAVEREPYMPGAAGRDAAVPGREQYLLSPHSSATKLPDCAAGRERDNDLECWVAVTTEAYAQALLAEMPLLQGDQRYLPQTKDALDNIAARIWEALKAVMAPFMGARMAPSPFG